MHVIEISISTSKYFDNQKQMASFLDIKNSSKKSIELGVEDLVIM